MQPVYWAMSVRVASSMSGSAITSETANLPPASCDLGGLLTDELAQQADIIVTMGCGDQCPVIPGKRYIDWDLPDPHRRTLEEVRLVRDDIARRVSRLIETLEYLVRADRR